MISSLVDGRYSFNIPLYCRVDVELAEAIRLQYAPPSIMPFHAHRGRCGRFYIDVMLPARCRKLDFLHVAIVDHRFVEYHNCATSTRVETKTEIL